MDTSIPELTLRAGTLEDIPELTLLIENPVRNLHALFYTTTEIDGALSSIYGVDTILVKDGNYFLAAAGVSGARFTEEISLPLGMTTTSSDAAKIRALFVHPDFTRLGIGSMLLQKCEEEAMKKGFKKAEMGATFAGVTFYERKGYQILREQAVDGIEERSLGNGEVLRLVRIGRVLV